MPCGTTSPCGATATGSRSAGTSPSTGREAPAGVFQPGIPAAAGSEYPDRARCALNVPLPKTPP
jgi:hypothetical protein